MVVEFKIRNWIIFYGGERQNTINSRGCKKESRTDNFKLINERRRSTFNKVL